MYLIYENGTAYRVMTSNSPLAKCYKCDIYEMCPKYTINKPCRPFVDNVYLKELPVEDSTAPDWNEFDFSKAYVKYKGKRIDKCSVKNYIHQSAYQLGNDAWPLLSDIYWYDMPYIELKNKLKENVYLLRALIKAKTHDITSE